jgi:hypothetical protein
MTAHFVRDAELRRRLSAEQWERIEAWLEKQPAFLPLIGPTAASKVLGVKPPHIYRLRDQGRLTPIPVEGAADVYRQDEVEALARRLEEERAERAARRESKA